MSGYIESGSEHWAPMVAMRKPTVQKLDQMLSEVDRINHLLSEIPRRKPEPDATWKAGRYFALLRFGGTAEATVLYRKAHGDDAEFVELANKIDRDYLKDAISRSEDVA